MLRADLRSRAFGSLRMEDNDAEKVRAGRMDALIGGVATVHAARSDVVIGRRSVPRSGN